MTGQLHHLIAQQQIADSHRAASKARLVRGERVAKRRMKPISALLAVLGIALITGTPARAAPRDSSAPRAQCEIRLPISVIPGTSRAHGSRYDSAGSAACIGPLGPWLTWGGTGSAVSSGAIVTARGARHCVPSAGHGRVFAVVPREAWFFPPDLTVSGAFRFHRVGHRLDLTGQGQLLNTRESPVSARLSLTGSVAFARRAGQACNSTRLRGTLTLRLAVQTA